MLTFSASSSVEVVAKCRVVKQASKQASSEWNGSQGYISGVLFVDGGFCVGNELSPAFKQVPALNIWPACRVQGVGMGDGLDGRGSSCDQARHI
jgi:hypothetical protein